MTTPKEPTFAERVAAMQDELTDNGYDIDFVLTFLAMRDCIRDQQAALLRCVEAACEEAVEAFSPVSNAADNAAAVLAKWRLP